mgnify:CR=1 FL=1
MAGTVDRATCSFARPSGFSLAASGIRWSFRTGATQLQFDGFDPIDIVPMHPTMVRPGNFTEKQFDASLVYLGRGSYDDLEALKGQRLNGTLAVMEYDCGESWMRFMRFGVRGFIFIEPDRDLLLELFGVWVLDRV